MLNKREFLNKMVSGKQYTIFYRDCNNNIPMTFQFTLNNVYFGRYAQHENALYFNIKIKGKRSSTLLTLIHDFVILEGWQELQDITYKKESELSSRMIFSKVSDFENHSNLLFVKHWGDSWDSDSVESEHVFNWPSTYAYMKAHNVSSCAGLI